MAAQSQRYQLQLSRKYCIARTINPLMEKEKIYLKKIKITSVNGHQKVYIFCCLEQLYRSSCLSVCDNTKISVSLPSISLLKGYLGENNLTTQPVNLRQPIVHSLFFH